MGEKVRSVSSDKYRFDLAPNPRYVGSTQYLCIAGYCSEKEKFHNSQ